MLLSVMSKSDVCCLLQLEKEVEALRLEQTQSTTSQESSENDEIVRIKREVGVCITLLYVCAFYHNIWLHL